MTSESQLKNTSKQTAQAFGVPVAIVIAGGLIAAALYFGGSDLGFSTNEIADTANVGDSAGVVAPPVRPTEPTVGDIREVTDEDHIRGAKKAKVTVVTYADLECPFCKRFHPTMQQLVSEYPSEVRWVYRHFPLEQLHKKATKEAEATECAGEQGKFWEFTDKIFEVTPSNDGMNMDDLPKLAQEVGVKNIEQFQSCLNSDKYADKVAADVADAQAAGGRGTPYSVVIAADGQKLPLSGAQPYSAVKQLIDQALKTQ